MTSWLIGTSDDVEKTIYDVDFKGGVAIVMEVEGEGMRRLTRETCDVLVQIPMLGSVESLERFAPVFVYTKRGRQRIAASVWRRIIKAGRLSVDFPKHR